MTNQDKMENIIIKAKNIIKTKGIEAYSSRLTKTDYKVVEKQKKTFFGTKTTKDVEISSAYASQIVLRNELKRYIKLLTKYSRENQNLNQDFYKLAKLCVTIENIYKQNKDNEKVDSCLVKTIALLLSKIKVRDNTTYVVKNSYLNNIEPYIEKIEQLTINDRVEILKIENICLNTMYDDQDNIEK